MILTNYNLCFDAASLVEGSIEFREVTTTSIEVLWGTILSDDDILRYRVILTSEDGGGDVSKKV